MIGQVTAKLVLVGIIMKARSYASTGFAFVLRGGLLLNGERHGSATSLSDQEEDGNSQFRSGTDHVEQQLDLLGVLPPVISNAASYRLPMKTC